MTTESIADVLDKALPLASSSGSVAIIAVKCCQQILTDYLPPDSPIDEIKCISQLLQVLDDKRVVRAMDDVYTPSLG